ncbi:hypothetical protein [Frankia sp. AgKG'84/4]|uniref:hypothetical protein n=1 Tax=Frankia sp. AgKG'84/4 TaxID=573490 RepID=UPI00200C36F4|nr:hypothetical protein [Frankia sp. AgKG'84/4]MCL9793638.1 hypothetical protein [Frankia sp. AgKG'84/4]
MPENPLFDYRPATSPSPLEAAGDPEKGTKASINISVLSGAQTIYADRIAVSVPVSTQSGTAYFTENPVIAVNDGRWQPVSVEADAGDELVLAGANNFVLTFHNASPKEAVNYPLVFSISGLIATTTGDPLLVQVYESSSTKPQGFSRKSPRTLTMPVIEPIFYLRNFLSRSPSRPTVPRTSIDAGDALQLSWESNGSYFWLYDGSGDDNPRYEGTGTSWSVSFGEIVRDTTFILKASAAGDGTQVAAAGFESVEQYASLTITVNNPTLTGLTIHGPVNAQDTVDVHGWLTAHLDATFQEGLTVQRELTVGQGLTVSGNLTARSRVDVNGLLSANNDLTVGSKLSTQGISGVRLEEDIIVGDKMSTSGHNGLRVMRDLSVDGSIGGFGGAEFVQGEGKYVRIRELRGPYGGELTINSTVRILDDCGLSVAGHDVIRHGDSVGLWNDDKSGWLYAPIYNYDSDRKYAFIWNPGDRVGGSSWWVSRD